MAKRRRSESPFAKNLAYLMKEKNMGVREAARIDGISLGTISNWSAGRNTFALLKVIHYSEVTPRKAETIRNERINAVVKSIREQTSTLKTSEMLPECKPIGKSTASRDGGDRLNCQWRALNSWKRLE